MIHKRPTLRISCVRICWRSQENANCMVRHYFTKKKVETAFMTMNDDVTGRISTKTVKVKCTSLLERTGESPGFNV